ncbi:MAG: hypothetical protein ACQSGP_03590 [Frankia sp.]
MTPTPASPASRAGEAVSFNHPLASMLSRRDGVELAGSIYAVPVDERPSAVGLLARQRLWIHADVFAERDVGVDPGFIADLAGRGVSPIDVHLLTSGALDALDAVCVPGVARVTFPYEGVGDIAGVARYVRRAGARPWLAIAPTTTLEECAPFVGHVDGLLIMMVEPGTQGGADLGQLEKVAAADRRIPVGVDGDVGEDNIGRVLAAGAGYVVIGRRLFAVTSPIRPSSPTRPARPASPDPPAGTPRTGNHAHEEGKQR